MRSSSVRGSPARALVVAGRWASAPPCPVSSSSPPPPALLRGLRVTPLGAALLPLCCGHAVTFTWRLGAAVREQTREGPGEVESPRRSIVAAGGGGSGSGAEAPQGDGHLCSQGQNEEDRLPVHALQLGPLRVEARLQPAPLAGRVWHHPGGKAGQSRGRACWAARLATHPPVSPSFCWQS